MGKGSAPPAPDYAAAAQAQGVANKETAQYNNGANRVNQVGPNGSITWSARPGMDPNNPQPGDYIETTTLSPEQQIIADRTNKISQDLMGTAEQQLGRVSSTFNTPLDYSSLPAWQGAPTVPSQLRTSGSGGNIPASSGGSHMAGAVWGGTSPTQQNTQEVYQTKPMAFNATAGAPAASPAAAPAPMAFQGSAAPAAQNGSAVFGGSGAGHNGSGNFAYTMSPDGVRTYADGSSEKLSDGAFYAWKQMQGGNNLGGAIQGYSGANPVNTGAAPGTYGSGSQGLVPQGGFQATPGMDFGQALTGAARDAASYGGGGFGTTGVPGAVNNASRQAVEQAILSRLEPQYAKDTSNLQAQLAARGLEVGSPAYNSELQRLSQAQNDARMQAVLAGGQEESRQVGLNSGLQQQAFQQGLQGAQFDNSVQNQLFQQGLQGAQFNNQNRQQMLAEMLLQRNTPLNELNALRTGTQVAMPQFGNYYTNNSATTPVFDAAVAQGNYNSAANAASQSGTNALIGGAATAAAAFF